MRMTMALLLVLVASCGGGGDSAGTFSCDSTLPGADGGAPRQAVCAEVQGGSSQDATNNQRQCASQGNTFAFAPCPRASLLGGCREKAPNDIVITTWYYDIGDGLTSSDDIRMLCEGLAALAPSALMITFVAP